MTRGFIPSDPGLGPYDMSNTCDMPGLDLEGWDFSRVISLINSQWTVLALDSQHGGLFPYICAKGETHTRSPI